MDTWFSIEKWWWKIVRQMGVVLATVFIKLGITANQLTVARLVVLGPCVLLGFALSGYWFPVLGLICLLIYGVLDFCDGTIARNTNCITKVGGWLDGRYDFLLQVIILAGSTWSVMQAALPVWWSATAIAALFSQAALVHHTDMYGGLFNHREDFFKDMQSVDMTFWERMIVDIVVTKSNLSGVIFTFRYIVILTVLLGHLEWLLLFIAITQNIRWLVLHIVMANLLSKQDELKGIWYSMWQYINKEYTVPH